MSLLKLMLSKLIRFIWAGKAHAMAVAIGGAMGALVRFAICGVVTNQILSVLICNITGSFILSAAVELRRKIHPDLQNLISIGFCGGLSIFASFSKDSVLALRAEDFGLFFANFTGNFVLCVCAIFAAEILVKKFREVRDNLRTMRQFEINNTPAKKIANAILLSPQKFADNLNSQYPRRAVQPPKEDAPAQQKSPENGGKE